MPTPKNKMPPQLADAFGDLTQIARMYIGPNREIVSTCDSLALDPVDWGSAIAMFLIGTIQDLLSGGLPGETAVTLLLARAIVLPQRHYLVAQPFPFIWAGFTLLTGGAMLFSWALHSLLAEELLDLRGPVLRTVLTISAFPIASFLLGRSQRALIGAD